jgi:hypothetical protein
MENPWKIRGRLAAAAESLLLPLLLPLSPVVLSLLAPFATVQVA